VSARPRRRLTTVDDPLVPAVATPPVAPPPVAPAAAPGPVHDERQALFVRLPVAETDALARAAFELRLHKREIVAALIAKHVNPLTADGLAAVRVLVEEYRRSRG